MAEEGSDPPPTESDAVAENLTLQEIADREARKRDASAPPVAKLPPFLGNLRPAQVKGLMGSIGFLVGAWLAYSVGGALARRKRRHHEERSDEGSRTCTGPSHVESGMNAALRATLTTAGGLPLVVGCLAPLGMTA